MSENTKLARFISSFRTEDDLRKAVVGLLEHMPNVNNVRLTHGTEERGKDIVFHSPGPFGDSQLFACVVKNNKITGSAESDDGARAVYIQAEQAFDTPIANPADGRDEQVFQIFVISPYECPPPTVDSIKGKLQARPGQIRFLCGHELMDKFATHYPDFLLFESGLLGSYVADLEKVLEPDSAIANVLFQHGVVAMAKNLSQVYVRPKFCKELRPHQLALVQLKTVDVLRDPLSRVEVRALGKVLIDMGRLVLAIARPDAQAESLDESLRSLTKLIEKRWEEGLAAHRLRTDLQDEERSISEFLARIQLSNADEIRKTADALLKEVNSTVDKLQTMLRSVDFLLRAHLKSAEAALESAQFLDYCQVEGIGRQVPAMVRADLGASRTFEFEESLVDSTSSNLFISGPAGFGKTSFCKYQTLRDLRRLKDTESNIIPVYIELHRHAQGELGSFESTFLRAPELIAVWKQSRSTWKGDQNRKFRLYLDGLDEVPSIDRQKALLDIALNAQESDPTMSIIVTGRDHVVGSHLRRFPRVQVRSFDDAQLHELAAKRFENDTGFLNSFFEQLERVPALRPLMGVPLLATLVFGLYKTTKALPESRTRLYEMFINLMAGGWDVAKNVNRQTKFGSGPKLTVLKKLAGTLHVGLRRDCSRGDLQLAVKRTLPGLQEQWEELLDETVQDGLLVPTGPTFAFAHLSYQEYLAAKDLFEPGARKATHALTSFLGGDEWWREVILFYIALSDKPKDIEQFVRETAIKVLARTADDSVKSRAHFLLEWLKMSFPGAQPDFNF